MKAAGRLPYFVCLAALAVVAALAMARVARPSIASAMVWAALLATAAGAPGLVRRRAWPLALLLLAAGAYLVARVQTPLPGAHGFLGLGFYLGQIRAGAHAYSTRTFPCPSSGRRGSGSCSRSSSTRAPASRRCSPSACAARWRRSSSSSCSWASA